MDLDHNILQLPPLHVGEVLREEFLNEFKLSAGQLVKACFVPRSRIERIGAKKLALLLTLLCGSLAFLEQVLNFG